MATVVDEHLEQFLTSCGLAWCAILTERHISLSNEWEVLFGNPSHWLHRRQGSKAQFDYSGQSATKFRIVPFLGDFGGPHSIKKSEARKAAYECHGSGTLPDLSAFAATDFFIVPDDWSWTMVHTHEDCGFGGPYFILKDWLGVPGRRRAR